MADEQEDYDALPLEDRLLHKVWKVRLNAYEETTRAFTSSPNDNAPCFKLFIADPDLLVKAVKDANVVAQEAGVALVLAYLTYGPMHSTLKTRAQVIPALVEKCLGSTRAGTRQKAIDTVLMYVELDSGEPVIEDLIPGLSAKLPKLVAATTLCIKSVYAAFGAKTVKAKPAVQVLPKLFAHADKNVRAEAIDLAITLYRWLGDVVKPLILADLKPVQVKELEQAFDGITVGDVKQERLLKSQQAAQEAAGGADDAAVDAAEEQEEQAVDAFDLAEPVDVLSTIPKNFEEAMLSSKWKDRKEVLDALADSSKVPRIREGDFGEVARLLGRCVQKDANVVCVSLAATCLEQLAKGLKRAFGRYRNVVFTPCAERFKEKKQNVLDAIAGALDAIFQTTTLEDVLEETLELLKSKNPSVRCQMLLFLSRSLSVTPVFPKQGEVKAIAEGTTALIGESDAKVRDAAAECLGTLMKLIGERAMGPYLEQIEELRKPKILECFAVATVKAKPEKPKTVPAAATGKPQPVKRLVKKAPTAGPASSPLKNQPRKIVPSSGYGPRASMAPGVASAGSLSAASGSRLARQSMAGGIPSSPATSRLSRPGGTGLQRPTAQNLARPPVSLESQSAVLAPADRLELDSLRREKAAWLATAGDRDELNALRAQIQELQSKNASLIESHTKHAMELKAIEGPYMSTLRELEHMRSVCTKSEMEIDALKKQLHNARAIAGHASARDESVRESYKQSPVAAAAAVPTQSLAIPASAMRSRSRDGEEKENRYASPGKSTERQSSGEPAASAYSSSGAPMKSETAPITGHAAAASLTAKLRSRIEDMKRADARLHKTGA